MTNKISYVSVINDVLNGVELDAERIEKLNALKVSLEKRANRKPNGPTKAQRERIALAEKVFEAMEAETAYGSADIAGLIPELEGASSQKVTALMKALGERVHVEKVKGKAVYTVA